MKYGLFWMVMCLTLASCHNHHVMTPALPAARTQAPLKFNVANVQVILSDAPSSQTRSQENMPYPEFKTQIEQWAARTFKSKGQQGTLCVIIEEAKVQENTISKKTQGLKGLFTYDQSEAYHATLGVRLELKDHLGRMQATTLTTAEHTRTVLENISVVQREQEILRLTHLLISELDDKIRANVYENMVSFLK